MISTLNIYEYFQNRRFYLFYNITLKFQCGLYHMLCKSLTQKHKHCKPNCVMHNSFARSLRKYDVSSHKRTMSSQVKRIDQQNQINRKQSLISLIKPFKTVIQHTKSQQICDMNEQKDKPSKQKEIKKQEIQQYILKVSLPNNIKPISIQQRKQSERGIQKFKSMQNTKQWHLKNERSIESTKWDIAFSGQISTNDDKSKQMSLVKSKDLKELEFNVQRISNIIDSFNKKLGKYDAPVQPFNSDLMEIKQKQYQKREYQQSSYNSPTNNKTITHEREMIKKEFHQSSMPQQQQSPIHEYSKQCKINKAYSKQNFSESPSTNNERETIDSTKLNYKMYNWNMKLQSLCGSHKKNKTKCHGGPHI